MASKKPQTITAAIRRGAMERSQLPRKFQPPFQPGGPGDPSFTPEPMAMLPTEPSAPKRAHWSDKYFKAGVW